MDGKIGVEVGPRDTQQRSRSRRRRRRRMNLRHFQCHRPSEKSEQERKGDSMSLTLSWCWWWVQDAFDLYIFIRDAISLKDKSKASDGGCRFHVCNAIA